VPFPCNYWAPAYDKNQYLQNKKKSVKVSYKVLKKYIPHIGTPEQVAQDLIMHTAEVEDIISQKEAFDKIVFGKITSVASHENADALRVCMVDAWEAEDIQIVCGGSNLEVWQGVAIAKIGASVLWHGQGEPVVMKKTAIRWVDSYGMICAAEEIGLADDFPAKSETEILDLSHIEAKPGAPLDEVLWKDDIILEVDNKAINHRPDLFSHIWIAREIEAIHGKKLAYDLTEKDFSHLSDLEIRNEIPHIIKRYIGLKVSWVSNIPSPDYVKDVLASHDIDSKGLLIDITNYSLYLYGQPTHCFDADKITGNIHIRFAKDGESFEALNDKIYTLTSSDIVIADDAWVIALGWVIGGKHSAVSDSTKNIIIESAWFEQWIIRHTGKRLGLRTDALNVFEKDLVPSLSHIGASLILKELEEHFEHIKAEAISDIYPEPQNQTKIEFLPEFICNLIGREYETQHMIDILHTIWVELEWDMLMIPRWRKDLTHIADIAEEIARLDGYDKVESTVPRINLWAVSQNPLYKAKRDIRNFLAAKGMFELYTYSFVDESLMNKALWTLEGLVPLKNYLTEDMTHMRWGLIPNLLSSLENNKKDFKNLKVFECEKVFHRWDDNQVSENYELSILEQGKENMFYEMRQRLDELFWKLGVLKYDISTMENPVYFAHRGRSASIMVRGKVVWSLGEIKPKVLHNFSLGGKVGYITINLNLIESALYGLIAAQDISSFQENNFDLTFVADKDLEGKNIQRAIEKTDWLIKKVELFDIYESEEKLPGKRAISFKIFIQSMNETLWDDIKNNLIESIIKNVEKVGGSLR